MVWVIGLGVLIVVALVVVVLRRRSTAAATASTTPVDAPPVDEPMTGLESALAQVTGRDGRPIREHIDAETQHVDDLRVPDDTGPLLRRALDHVAQPGVAQPGVAQPRVAQPGAPADELADTAPGDTD